MAASDAAGPTGESGPTVALIHSGDVIEDYLDPIGITLEEFRTEMTGGWMFNYLEALADAGLRPVLVCVSREARRPARTSHRPTGATMLVLPPRRLYRFGRERTVGWKAQLAGGPASARGGGASGRARLSGVAPLASYLATPLRSLAHELRREGCRALICQEYEQGRFDMCVAMGRVARIAVFGTFQGGSRTRHPAERVLRSRAVRSAAGLIVAASAERERVVERYRLDPSAVAQIFNPIDLSTWEPIPREQARSELGVEPSARVAVWHGRIAIQAKGLDVLAEAWAQVERSDPRRERRLWLIGGGPDEDRLRQLLERLEVRAVEWMSGYTLERRAIALRLSAADVHVFPSRREGFPVAPIEAMACGLPVVAAEASGVTDIFENGEGSGGVLVPSDDAESLARAVASLLDAPDRARQIGDRARRRVETAFAIPAVGRQLRDFLVPRI